MVRHILLRVTYDGKEHLIEAPAGLSVGRLAEIVGRAVAPTEATDGVVRYELCLSEVPLAENERVGRACVSLQPGQALQVRIVRERTRSSAAPAGVAPQGSLRSAFWVLGGRAIAAVGDWGAQLWDTETQQWQLHRVVEMPVLHAAGSDNLLLCALKQGSVALWSFAEVEQRWHGRANRRLSGDNAITSLALTNETAAVGTERGYLYLLSVPDLGLDMELQPKPNLPVRLLHWLDPYHCLKLNADSTVELWRAGEMKPLLERDLALLAHLVGAVNVSAADTPWALLLFAEPMQWAWITLGGVRTIAPTQPSSERPVSLAFGQRTRVAWVGFADGSLQAWQVNDAGQTPQLHAQYKLNSEGLRQVLLSRNEQWLVSISKDNQIRVHPIQDLQSQ